MRWATRVSGAAIRHRGDLEARRQIEQSQETEEQRFLEYWYTEDRFGLRAEFPAAQGSVIAKALERVAETIPVMPGEGAGPYPPRTRSVPMRSWRSARPGSLPIRTPIGPPSSSTPSSKDS